MAIKYALHALLITLLLYPCANNAIALKIEQNNYGDPIIVVHDDCMQADLAAEMDTITRSFFVRIPYDKGALIPFLKSQGCSFYYANNQEVWLKKEIDVELTNPFTCASGTNVLITKKVDDRLYALFTIEKGKKYATWPGGMLNPGERMRLTGIRECKEEISIEIDPNRMSFLGVLHRRNGKFGSTIHEYYFHTEYDGQDIIPNGEVLKAVWIPAYEAIKGFVEGMPIREHKRRILEEVYNGARGRPCVEMPEWPTTVTRKNNTLDRDFYPGFVIDREAN